jgi:hypothetical protein
MSTDRSCRVESHALILDSSTQRAFHDEFWGSVDVVVNALDSTTARKFVGDKCVRFSK